jgi:integrase/recombinase XerD
MTRTRYEPECSGDMNSIVGNCEFKDCAHVRRPVTPHVLRHTVAVTAVQKGISLPVLQRLLGHDRLATTGIYLNLSPEKVVREFREKW